MTHRSHPLRATDGRPGRVGVSKAVPSAARRAAGSVDVPAWGQLLTRPAVLHLSCHRVPSISAGAPTSEEVENLRSQIATANVPLKSRVLPYVFTEHGVLMLASVLKSETAIKASVHIIEIFVRMREMVLTHKDILLKLEQLEQQQARQDVNIKQLYQYIKGLMVEKKKPRSRIGF